MDAFEKAHEFTARWEGGYIEHANDPGGATKYGISLRFLKQQGLEVGDIALASALRQLKRGYKQRTRAQQAVTVFLNAVLTTSLAVGCVLLLPLAMPDVTPETQVAGAVVRKRLGKRSMRT